MAPPPLSGGAPSPTAGPAPPSPGPRPPAEEGRSGGGRAGRACRPLPGSAAGPGDGTGRAGLHLHPPGGGGLRPPREPPGRPCGGCAGECLTCLAPTPRYSARCRSLPLCPGTSCKSWGRRRGDDKLRCSHVADLPSGFLCCWAGKLRGWSCHTSCLPFPSCPNLFTPNPDPERDLPHCTRVVHFSVPQAVHSFLK